MIRLAIDQFSANMERIAQLGHTYSAVEKMTTSVIDLSDILRSRLVLAVSALDHFIHELVRLGMIEIHSGVRQSTDAYARFQLPISSLVNAQSNPRDYAWLDQLVREKHSWLSFQDPVKIADAVRLISKDALWDELSGRFSLPAKDLKIQLKLIVDRRNKIAHEADLVPDGTGDLWPIDKAQVDGVVIFIERLCHEIYSIVK